MTIAALKPLFFDCARPARRQGCAWIARRGAAHRRPTARWPVHCLSLAFCAMAAAGASAQADPPAAAGTTPAPMDAASQQPGSCGPAGPPEDGAPLKLRSERALGGGHGHGTRAGPVFVRADRASGSVDDEARLQGSVEVRRDGVVLRGESAEYRFETDELKMQGKVHFADRGAVFDGPSLNIKLEAHSGSMSDAHYTYAGKEVSGQSRLIEFLDDQNVRMHDATYTTCTPNSPSWWLRAETIDINRDDQEAVAHSSTLYFEGIPIFASPYFDMPLGDQSRSGLLTPGFYQNSRLGQEFIVPIYWNIAPNRDYTLTPDVMPRRGVSLGNEFRFLEPEVRGQLDYEVMPNDRTTGTTRDHVRLLGQYANFSGLAVGVDFNRVSDDNYFIDFSHNIINASAEVLAQDVNVTYTQPYWNAGLRMSKNQTLVTLLAADDPGPYERAPEASFRVHREDWHGFDIASSFDATRFQHPAINPLFVTPVAGNTEYTTAWYTQDGSRYIVNPIISYPLITPGWFLTPKVQWHYTDYELDPTFHVGNTGASRSLPIASLDSGLVFERAAQWLGSPARQTLEPRVFYAFAPYRDQSQLPNFDSAAADFNYAELFTENTFTGSDRIAQANQVTTAVVSRIIDEVTGAERLRLALGQRYYFSSQPVTLPGQSPRTNLSSDILFLGSAALGRRWSLSLGLDYSTASSQLALATVGMRWQPRAASVLNFSYRYESAIYAGTLIDQFRASAQWPMSAHWYGVGALDYSVADHGWVESVAGVEYKADCWVGRFVLSRYAVVLPSTVAFSNSYTTAWFFQIELNGLTSIGTNPLDQLQRSISGFQKINPMSGPGGPFDHYE